MNAKSAKSATETTEKSPKPNERHFVYSTLFTDADMRARNYPMSSDVRMELAATAFKGGVRVTFVTARGTRREYDLSSMAVVDILQAAKANEKEVA